MNQKKLFSAVVAGALTATSFIGAMPNIVPGIGSIQASAVEISTETSGTCGENVTWELDKNKTLTINGCGDMYDYSYGDSPFYLRKDIVSVVISDGVTSIGSNMFRNCTNLKSVTIPDSVVSIGMWAFDECTKLESVSIGNSVSSIGDYAFAGCDALTNVKIPESVTSIGSCAFINCDSLAEITVPDSVTNLAYGAFHGCSSLASVTLPEGITSIEGSMFGLCESLESITIPESVTSIGDFAFEGCSSLASITLPDGITSIGINAFVSCRILTSINIPENTLSIGDGAFSDCPKLKEITIPESVTSIGDFAFTYCDSLERINVSEDNKNYSDVDGILFNKDKTELIRYAEGKHDEEYIVPEGVTSIGKEAFLDSKSITSIILPDSVTSIDESAFYFCSNLKSVNIPEGVKSIEFCTFALCSSLENITFPNSVTKIGESAFYGCEGLTNVTIPENIEYISDKAFDGCSCLESLTIKNPECVIYDIYNNIPNTVTICGYRDSTAQAYAEKYGCKFEILDKAPKAGKVSAPTVAEDGTVSWNAAENAAYYRVAKYANGKTYYGAKTKGTSYKLNSIPTTDYIVSVIAYNADGDKTVGDKAKVKVDAPLGYVNNVSVDENGNVTWQEAKNAAAYRVVKVVNGKSYYAPKTTATSYKLAAVPKKDYQIFVIAYGENGSKSYGNKNIIEVGDLGVVLDAKADKNGNITWSTVRNADYYRVGKITGGKTYVGTKTKQTNYKLSSVPTVDYQVFVAAFDKDGHKTTGTIVNVKADIKLSDIRDIDGNDTNYAFTYNGEEFSAVYTPDNWHITDSYKITDKNDITAICKALSAIHPIHNKARDGYRTAEDMAYEWEQHNIAYNLLDDSSEWKAHVKDVDIDPDDQGKSFIDMAKERLGLN